MTAFYLESSAWIKKYRPEAGSDVVEGIRLKSNTVKADAYLVALGSYSPLLLRPLGIHIPVYPLKGYSITLPLDSAAELAGATRGLLPSQETSAAGGAVST